MRRLLLSACLVVLAAGSAAQGQECDRSDDSQSMMTICAGADYQAADAKLNAAYKDLVGRNDDNTNKLLQTAQRAWIAFRDADCASLYDQDWGTISRVEAASCRLDLTARRADALEDFRQAQ